MEVGVLILEYFVLSLEFLMEFVEPNSEFIVLLADCKRITDLLRTG